MKANLCAYKYKAIYQNWAASYYNLMTAFTELGIEVNASPFLSFQTKPDSVSTGIETDEAIHVYNHSYLNEIMRDGFFRDKSLLNIFIKPTGPGPQYFTLDTLGYGPYSTPAYKKDYEILSNAFLSLYFQNNVQGLINSGLNKWIQPEYQFNSEDVDLPENHTLVLGQMTADTTVREFSFGNHWDKLDRIVDTLLSDTEYPVVVKLHPTFKTICEESDMWDQHLPRIKDWENRGVKVLTGFINIHKVLKNTRVAIVENSTSGLEVLMNRVPLISYGFPEYVFATKDLRHLSALKGYVEDLSWYNSEVAGSWLYWYLESYVCHDYKSTKNRLANILQENNIYV